MSDSLPGATVAFPAPDGTLGALEIGAVVATFLFGVETLQTFNYYRQYPKDSVILRISVAFIWFLELAHTICALHAVYSLSVTYYGQVEHLFNPPYSLQTTILFSSSVYTLVQIFFANRLHLLSGSRPIPFLCYFLNLLRFGCNLAMFAFSIGPGGIPVLQSRWHSLMATAFSLGAGVDVLTALSTCYCLWKLRNFGHTHTRRIVDTLIFWSIETTSITSATGLVLLILFLTRSDLAWLSFHLIQAKLFSNSMLAALNGRQRLQFADEEYSGGGAVIHFTSSSKIETEDLHGSDKSEFDGAKRVSKFDEPKRREKWN
ncbi:hypothetical protein B0H17DRAFT_1195252 [Mycena rosella]|uniref:DUF6534 domain-containing protein n=1 Tax=Mycena rosella TaxID=1033263 RepID=A0AAD7GMC3_MYCRO|nr:hypothetical protein B0H17DRAFT_1195252 [Mycena rosella]